MHYRPRRSVLYMPATNERAIEKGKSLPADAIVFDLEDAVVPEQKVAARERLAEVIAAGGYGSREIVARCNGLDTPWGADDIMRLAAAGPDAILLPKVTTVAEVARASELIGASPAKPALWLMIETTRAILAIADIARMAEAPGTRLSCLVMGTNDLVKETRAELDADRSQALYWFSSTLAAARAYGLDVLDGVYNDFKDLDGFRRECLHGRRLGMDGKTLIHPSQIDTANDIFSPSPSEIQWARQVVEHFRRPENSGSGAIQIEGRMVERLHLDVAERILSRAGGTQN
ncbi:MAG: (3S)-malyl-CoA thioesterase [Pseudomonadota bacterium]|jgi:citrate lyase subunit beta/citryl-CoA lyase